MVKRKYWINRIEQTWKKRSIVWLAGVRRVGKTFLCRSLDGVEYFDCELPRVRRQMEDPEDFLSGVKGKRIILDEIHRLLNPSELLKIAADHYPTVRIVATGSSSLGGSMKFKDTLTGRKTDVWLTPMTIQDLEDFGNKDLRRRMTHGGLPPFFLADPLPEKEYQEWMDAFWTKDIQELFRLERRASFQKFLEMIFAQSGSLFEANRFARPCEVSRTTISNYLAVLENTFTVHIVRPYSSHRPSEIISAPKVYGFDTGFVCYFRGWEVLRMEDHGVLWEHWVLNELQAHFGRNAIHYWRDKRGHEVDFVLFERGKNPIAIECKWNTDRFDPAGLQAFRRQYPKGDSFVVAHDVDRAHTRRFNDLAATFENLQGMVRRLEGNFGKATLPF